MSIPLPKQELDGHCSAIHDDTLYVLSSTGLQSLPLKENATWSEEKAGVLVTGAACVTVIPKDDASKAALYVVGGTAGDDSYNGLQRYFFGSKTWETLSPLANNMQGRTNHSAAYLNDSQSIVVYAGSTPDAPSYLSSQTFLIQTESPYNIESFTSIAAPANQPILQPWNSSHAVMAGGTMLSDAIYTFDPTAGWQALGTNLSKPLAPGTRGTIVDGSDGSRVLETYDMVSLPNKVSQTVLLDAGGQTAADGQTVGNSSTRKRKRDLALDNWPTYNNTDAPSTSRSDYSIAQGTDGLAVIAGGDADQPVSLFNQTGNSWVDAGKFFNGDDQQPLVPSSTSAAPSATPTQSAEPSAATTTASAAGGLSPHDKMLRTLGITLGVLCGIAAVFIIALLFVRHRKNKKSKNAAYGDNDDEKQGDRLSFADRGASFMKEAGGSITNITPPPKNRHDTDQTGSHSSLAIIGGKFGNKRNTPNHAAKDSMESTANLVRDKNGTPVGHEPVEMLDVGDKKYLTVEPLRKKPVPQNSNPAPPNINVLGASPEDDSALRDRSSGWSRYFSTGQPNDSTHLPLAYKDRRSDASEWPTSSHASGVSRIPSSVLVSPLNIDFSKTVDGQRLSNVISASPAFSDSREDLARRGSTIDGQQGQIETGDRPLSSTNTMSSYDRSTMSSDFYNGLSSGNTLWTPFTNSFKDHANTDRSRPTSSLYTASVYEQRVPSRHARGQNSGFFPGSGTAAFKPPKLKLGHAASPSGDWASAGGAAKDSPLLKSPRPITAPAPVHDRDSTATVFPHKNGNRWTANVPKDVTPGALQPPRIPGFGNQEKASEVRDSTVTVFPHNDGNAWTAESPGDLRPPHAPGMSANDGGEPAQDRDSTLTIFPRGVPSAYYANRPKEMDELDTNKKPMGSDMSWLNLGLGAHRV